MFSTRMRGAAVRQLVENAPGHWREERAASTGGIEHPARGPVDAAGRGLGDQPGREAGRRVVDAHRRAVRARQGAGVGEADVVGGGFGVEPGCSFAETVRKGFRRWGELGCLEGLQG